jgi:23S rRNA-/tRNA-specific pseudouridylate synthase
MMKDFIPKQPANSFRITLELNRTSERLDNLLLAALKEQSQNPDLKQISRSKFKNLFNDGKIEIKGQRAKPTSKLVAGTTYIDILGFKSAF